MPITTLRCAALAALALLPGCELLDEAAPSPWRPVADAPLSPRANAVGVWTGREAIFVGGRDRDLCPPNAGCVAPDDPPLADGAAFDPQTGRWRRIADAPVGFDFAHAAFAGGVAYFHVPSYEPGGRTVVLAYDVGADRWTQLAHGPDERYNVVAAGDRLVAYDEGDGRAPELLLDADAGRWRALPADPLGAASGRVAAGAGDALVVFARPHGRMSLPTRAAAYSFTTGRWRHLPDAPMIGVWPWARVGDLLVNPHLMTSQGADPRHAEGAILDLRSGTWEPLPATPFAQDDGTFGVGVYAGRDSRMFGHGGWALHLRERRWFEVPRPDGDDWVDGRALVSAGERVVVFGGVRWDRPAGTPVAETRVLDLRDLAG